MPFADDVNRILRDHEGYTGDGQGGVGDLPIGDRSTSRKPITKRDLREALLAYGDALADLEGAAFTYATWADGLLPVVGRADGQGAEVFDGDAGTHGAATATGYDGGLVPNAGRYSWNATWGRWVRIGDTGLASKAVIEAEAALRSAMDDLRPDLQDFGPNGSGLVAAIVDEFHRIAWGVRFDGGQVWGPVTGTVSADNSLQLVAGVADASGRLAWGVDAHGGFWSGATYQGQISDDTSLGLKWGIADSDGRVALGVRADGSTIITLGGGAVYLDAGDVYSVSGTKVTRITQTGDCIGPFSLGNGQVRFGSTRRRGKMLLYEAQKSIELAQAHVAYTEAKSFEMVLGWGQSLMQGGANAAITITAPFPGDAFRFENGPIGSNDETLGTELEPLREEVNETISTSFARATLTTALDRKLLLAGQAWGGMQIEDMMKGGSTGVYEKIIAQAEAAAALSGGAHCRAILNIHGEADGITSDPNYADDLRALLDDFNVDLKAALGQTDDVVMLFCQTSSNRYYDGLASADQFTTPFAQLAASEANADMFLVGPKYWLTYNTGGNDSHIDAPSVQDLGEKYAQVYRQVVINGEDWRPVSPASVSVSGNNVVIDFHSPLGRDLQFDTTNVTNPGDYGFNLMDAGGATITAVSLTGARQVTVTLSAPPVAGWRLSYAFHNGTDGYSGPTQGARGCLRDDDPLTSIYTGNNLFNWCVAFQHTF